VAKFDCDYFHDFRVNTQTITKMRTRIKVYL